MTAIGITVGGSYGMWLLWTALALGWRGVRPGTRDSNRPAVLRRAGARLANWLGMRALGVHASGLVVGVLGAAGVGGLAAYSVFGGVFAPGVAAVLSAGAPLGAMRSHAERRRSEARDAWPALLEQLRIETGSLGRSVPQALVEVGRRAPEELRPAFALAEREWRRSTSAARMLETLAAALADSTADVVCETLIVAAEVGGSDLDARLAALIEDRSVDLRHRKDARARQAGVRFARRFVLAVPAGMALAGLSIGTGREAYGTIAGQVLVACGLLGMAGCWIWAGRYLTLPTPRRLRA